MLIAKDREKLNQIKKIALHGMSLDAWDRFSEGGFKHYDIVAPGFKYNMTDIQAALGLCQLEKLEKMNICRQKIIEYYIKELEKFIETKIASISTSPERNDTILIVDPFNN